MPPLPTISNLPFQSVGGQPHFHVDVRIRGRRQRDRHAAIGRQHHRSGSRSSAAPPPAGLLPVRQAPVDREQPLHAQVERLLAPEQPAPDRPGPSPAR